MAYQNKSDTCSSLEVSRTYCTMAENHPQTLQNPVEFLLKSPLYNSGKSLSGLGDYYLDWITTLSLETFLEGSDLYFPWGKVLLEQWSI